MSVLVKLVGSRYRFLNTVAFLTLFVFFMPLNAQQDDRQSSANTSEKIESEEAKTRPDADKNASKKAKSNEPVFKPTEEISEDLPVPFPVDI